MRMEIKGNTEHMRKHEKRTYTALLLGAALIFHAGCLHVQAADPAAQSFEEAVAAQAAAEAAATQAAVEAQMAADAAAEAAINGGQAPVEAEGTAVGMQSSGSGRNSRRKEPVVTEQVKKDIEDSLDTDVKDAVMNGYLSLLNKEYILKDELELDLVSIGNGHELERRSAEAITRMVEDAKKEGMYISITSSYRTYSKQVTLFKNKIRRLESAGYAHMNAVEEAGKVVAVPGTSEHQLGLTVDFVTGSYKVLDEGIRNTKEYRWIEEHAWEYGYVIRYPSGKSGITGIISEPWHLRYVGIPAAKLMTEQEICLEEFLGVAYDGQRDGISYGAGWVNTGR